MFGTWVFKVAKRKIFFLTELIPDDITWAEVPEFDASNLELSEEEQARLLEEYEQEIKEREKAVGSGRMDPVDEALLIQSDIEKTPQKKPAATASSSNSSTSTKKSQSQPQSANSRNTNQKSQQQKGANVKPTGKAGASGNSKQKTPAKQQKQPNELKIEKDHFTKDDVSSSNSDESWEKEFDLEE